MSKSSTSRGGRGRAFGGGAAAARLGRGGDHRGHRRRQRPAWLRTGVARAGGGGAIEPASGPDCARTARRHRTPRGRGAGGGRWRRAKWSTPASRCSRPPASLSCRSPNWSWCWRCARAAHCGRGPQCAAAVVHRGRCAGDAGAAVRACHADAVRLRGPAGFVAGRTGGDRAGVPAVHRVGQAATGRRLELPCAVTTDAARSA